MPETVSVALAELASEVQEGLLALAVATGLQVLTALMEEDVTAGGPAPHYSGTLAGPVERCRPRTTPE